MNKIFLYLKTVFCVALLAFAAACATSSSSKNRFPDEWVTITNGRLWLTPDGDTVQAHAPGFLQQDGVWYMVGEDRSHEYNPDVNLYRSTDLQHWTFVKKIIENGVTDPDLGKQASLST